MHGLLGEVRAALGPTIVMVTHDLAEAALADTVAVLIDGALARCGTLDELYRSPGSLEVARMLGGFSEIPGVLTAAGHDSVLGRVRVEGSEQDRAPGTRRCSCCGRRPSRWSRRRTAGPTRRASWRVSTRRDAPRRARRRRRRAHRCPGTRPGGAADRGPARPRRSGRSGGAPAGGLRHRSWRSRLERTVGRGSRTRNRRFSSGSSTECCAHAGTSSPVSGCAMR